MSDVERVTETTTAQPVQNGVVTETTRAQSAGSGAKAEMIVRFLFGVLLSVLAIRFVFALLGADQTNAFANFIYQLSYPFVAPFFGIFGYTFKYGVSRFEFETLVAMAIYALVGYGVSKLVSIARA